MRGEVKLFLYNPESTTLEKSDRVYLRSDSKHSSENFKPISILSFRKQGKSFLIHLEGYHSPESVSELKGKEIFLPLDDLPPRKKGEFYYFELIGMEVYTVQEEKLGIIERIENYGASEILVIRNLGKGTGEVLIPLIPNLLKEVSLSEKKIVIDPPEGLF